MDENETPPQTPLALFRRGRERGQNGRVEIVGKATRKWKGHFYIYEIQADGSEVRKHRVVMLGSRSDMTRKQANDALRAKIAAEAEGTKVVKAELTFGQFWKERFLPVHGEFINHAAIGV